MCKSIQSASYYRCIFCLTKDEQKVVRAIQDLQLGTALFPQKVEPFGRKGVWRDVVKPLLPGYVFVRSEEAYPMRNLFAISGVIRVLNYGPTDNDGYLSGKDRRFVEWLFRNDGVINKLEAVQEGSFVRIVDGLLKDYNGKVEKVDKRKRMACLSLEIVGSIRQIWLGFELMEVNKKEGHQE